MTELLRAVIQNYDWGKKGRESFIAQLFQIDSNEQNFAELWIGTHPSGCSKIMKSGINLIDYRGKPIPFLLKILSIGKPLSIQLHPDEESAIKLHQMFPETYKDPNPKHEMAIALTHFEAMVGFKPWKKIIDCLNLFPEVASLMSIQSIQDCLQNLFNQSESAIKQCTVLLLKRSDQSQELNLFKRLYESFPNDVGCFFAFLLNHLVLEKGQSIFINTNEPHAYICGDIVECMVCSDNVVRAGLTSKPKDKDLLMKLLNFDYKPINSMVSLKFDQYCELYNPPFDHYFSVAKVVVVDNNLYTFPSKSLIIKDAILLIVLDGCGKINDIDVEKGTTMYSNQSLDIFAIKKIEIYLAFQLDDF